MTGSQQGAAPALWTQLWVQSSLHPTSQLQDHTLLVPGHPGDVAFSVSASLELAMCYTVCFNFEVIVDAQATVRNDAGQSQVPLTHSDGGVGKTKGQCQPGQHADTRLPPQPWQHESVPISTFVIQEYRRNGSRQHVTCSCSVNS